MAMTIPAVPTFAVGQKLTAATMTQIGQLLTAATDGPRGRAYSSNGQTIPNGTATKINFQGASVKDITWTAGAPTELVIATPGRYEVSAVATFDVNTTGYRIARIGLNSGTDYSVGAIGHCSSAPATGAWTTLVIPPLDVSLDAGDVLELWALQNSGATLATVTGMTQCSLRARWISSS